MHQFDERHPAFEGFSQFYFQVIGQRLRDEEAARKAAVKKSALTTFVALIAAFLIVSLFLLVIPYLKFGLPAWERFGSLSWRLFFVFCVFASAMGLCMGAFPFERVKASTRYSLIGGFCKFMRWSSLVDGYFDAGPRRFVELELIPGYRFASIGDSVAGESHGVGFSFCRAKTLQYDSRKTVFNLGKSTFTGQFIVVSFKGQFRGRTVVFPDKGLLNRKNRGSMRRVRLVDPVFEKKYEVYGTDQVEARYLLSPDFMQRLVDLEHSFHGKSLRFGFIKNQLLIAIETPMRLGAGSMLRPLDNRKRMQHILDVMGAIYDVIDGVTKPQEPISVNPHSTAA